MLYPILGVETDSKDVDIFESIEHAESYMEPEDADEWEVYTAEGLIVRVTVEGRTQGLFANRGHIKLEVTTELAVEKLKLALQHYLSVLGQRPAADSSLGSLVQLLLEVDEPR